MLAARRFSADFEVLRAQLLIWARLIDVAGVTQDMSARSTRSLKLAARST
jgi:hypothetical protein